MLDHLIGLEIEVETQDELDAGFEPVVRVPPNRILAAQQKTSNWLAELGAPGDDVVVGEAQREAARTAFGNLTVGADADKQREALLTIKSPAAMTHLNAMLEAHDWEFVARAKELRTYAVTKIIKETEHVDARIRLRALELLGKVTEVGLFTERIEIKKKEVGDSELEQRIKEKLERMMISNGQLEDATVKEIEEIEKIAVPVTTPQETQADVPQTDTDAQGST